MHIPNLNALLGDKAAGFLAERHRLLIGDAWVDSQSGETFDVIDPASGQVIAKVPAANAGDVDRTAGFNAIEHHTEVKGIVARL